MMGATGRFADRREAGKELSRALAALKLDNPLVLALPRGGVPVAYEVATALSAPLELMMVRKIGAPGHLEFAIGAIADGSDPQTVLNEEAISLVRPDPGYIEAESKRQLAEIERRRQAYLGGRKPTEVAGRTVVLVDDGIATGSTAKVGLIALRRAGAKHIVLAVPVAPRSTLDELGPFADRVVCLASPEPVHAVGLHYVDFGQTTDEEVVDLLRKARESRPSAAAEAEL